MKTVEKIVYRLIFAKRFSELVTYHVTNDNSYVEIYRIPIDFYNVVGDLVNNYYWYKENPNSFQRVFSDVKIPKHPFYEIPLDVDFPIVIDKKMIDPFYNGMFLDFRTKIDPIISFLENVQKVHEKKKTDEVEARKKLYEDFKRDFGVNYLLNRYKVDKVTEHINISDLSENLILDATPSEDNLYLYCYDCEDLVSLVFATIHNYFDREYKIIKCKHCQKYFVPFEHNDQYCKRNSLYKFNNCDSKQCEEAVRYIFKILDRRFQSIRSNLSNKSNGGYYKPEHNTFFKKAEEFNKIMRKSPTIKNILEYEKYLGNPELPKWRRK